MILCFKFTLALFVYNEYIRKNSSKEHGEDMHQPTNMNNDAKQDTCVLFGGKLHMLFSIMGSYGL